MLKIHEHVQHVRDWRRESREPLSLHVPPSWNLYARIDEIDETLENWESIFVNLTTRMLQAQPNRKISHNKTKQ